MTSATTNPRNARLTEVQRIDQTWPSSTVLREGVPDVDRRRDLELVGDRRRPDELPDREEQQQRHQRRQPGGQRPAPPGTRAWWSGCRARRARRRRPRRPPGRRAAASGRVVRSSARIAAGSGHAAWLVMTCRSRPVISVVVSSDRPVADPPLAHDGARPRRQQHHPLGEPDRLPHVVGDEQDRGAGGLPHPQQLALQHVAGDRVERRERLVHQQHAGTVLGLAAGGRGRERAGQRDALAHAAGELVRALVALARRAGPATSSSSARCRRSRRPRPASCSGSSTLRRAVSHGSSAASWNMNDGRAVPSDTSPAVGSSSPATRLSSVDLPQPDAPSRQTNSPGSTCRSMPRSAVTASAPCPNVLPTPRSVSAGRTRPAAGVGAFDGRGHLVGHP